MAISAGGASGRLGGPALSARLYLDGEFWTLQAGGATLRLRDGKGLRHLADLARSANTATSDDVAANAKPVEDRRAQPHAAPPAGLRERLRELDEELEEAEALHDIERAARARRELQRIERDVAQRIGAGDVGASEDAAASAERARVNVTRALRATLKRISGRAPELGRYLDLSVTTGMSCTFAPAHGFELQVGDAPAAPRLSAAAALAPAPAPDQAANRAGRTLVSIEVTSSADIAARLGETRWQDMLTRHDATVRAQANFFGGTAAPRNGDLTLLVFDAPDAATRCARAIVEGGRESGVVARAGVHHGECELLGDSVSGLAVHAAGRLAALAEPGQVLLSEDVQRQLAPGEIAVTDAGDHHELRGVPGEWHVYALARTAAAKPAATPAEKASEAPAALPLPPRLHALTEHALFGREVELDVVDTAVARAVGGTHPFIAIAGEPGIGKTRLAAEAAARAHQHGATVLHGRCDEDLAIPYQPIVEALSHYVDAATPLALGALRGGGPLARLLPQLATDSAPATGIYDSVSDGERYVLYSQVASLLASVPGTSLVLVVDDIQWADRETLLLLKFLLRAPAPARLALLTTYRSTDLDDGHPLAELLAGLAHDEAFTRIELQGLGQADILALTAQLAGEELPAPLLELSRALAG